MKKMISLMGIFMLLVACNVENDVEPIEEKSVEIEKPIKEDNEIEQTADVALARETFQKSCINCHGGDLEFGGGPELTSLNLSPNEILKIIREGFGSMPPFLEMSDEEAENLSIWISQQ